MLTTGGQRNSESMGPPAVPMPGPQVELRLPAWVAQGPQNIGAGSRLPYWPRGSAQGREERPERAVPGMGTGRARAVPGMTVVGRGPVSMAKNGVPTTARGVFIYKTRRGGCMWLNQWPPVSRVPQCLHPQETVSQDLPWAPPDSGHQSDSKGAESRGPPFCPLQICSPASSGPNSEVIMRGHRHPNSRPPT